jgi:hypothetical protein
MPLQCPNHRCDVYHSFATTGYKVDYWCWKPCKYAPERPNTFIANRVSSDPYKPIYEPLWKQHSEKVKVLAGSITSRYPILKDGVVFGFGAATDKYLDSKPREKNEPDINLRYNGKLLCSIEVSGTDKVAVPPGDIWLRPGKIGLSINKEVEGFPYWFWMKYKNKVYVLRAGELKGVKLTVEMMKLYKNVPERYARIPLLYAHPESYLFEWMDGILGVKYPLPQRTLM